MARNPGIEGEDSRGNTTPVYLYRIADATLAEVLYLTNYPTAIELQSPPAAWTDASDPQTFSPAAINHGKIERKDGIDETSFELVAKLGDGSALSRYVIFGVIPRIDVQVIKTVPGSAAAGSATCGVDSQVMQRGLVSEISVLDFTLQARVTPEAFLTSQEIPRWRFTRTCNHQLFGDHCGVDPTSYQHQGGILALDVDQRQVTVAGDSGLAADYFRQGYMLHAPTGMKISIFASSLSSGNTILTLHQWLPDMEVTDNVTAFAGCRHTIDDCTEKFDNAASFGGFPLVPNKNPTIHGAE